MRVHEKEGKITVKFNPNFYSEESIKRTAEDFKEVCEAEVTIEKDIVVKLTPKEEIDNLGHEFANYVLGIMKNEGI